MLQAGPCSVDDFKKLNSKYPSDVPYYIRTLMKVDVKTVRTAKGSVYMLAEHYATYLEGLKKEKEKQQAKASAKEAKPDQYEYLKTLNSLENGTAVQTTEVVLEEVV